MPSFLDSTADASAIWKRKSLVDWHRTQDTWGRPAGLGYGDPMRWGTAAALLDMLDQVNSIMGEIHFPLLVLHDPQDGIVPHVGSLTLMERAPSSDKTFVEMQGSLHDQMCNSPEELTEAIHTWVQQRFQAS